VPADTSADVQGQSQRERWKSGKTVQKVASKVTSGNEKLNLTVTAGPNCSLQRKFCAPGRIRTCDHRFRKPMLYPLSYGGYPAYFMKFFD
jgi:hypothetical protein